MPNLNDIARMARVSIATVSRVINEPISVREQTRARVQRAMTRMEFLPNRVARRLRRRGARSQLIGLIIPEIENPHFAEIVRGVEDTAYALRFAVMLCNSDDDPEKERFYLDILRAESVDGVIVPPIHDRDPNLFAAAKAGLPIVAIDRRLAKPTIDSVIVDNRLGTKIALEHLLQRGYRTIAHIAGPQQNPSYRDRLETWTETLACHGLPVRKDYVCFGDSEKESGAAAAEVLLSLRRPPRALFVANSLMAAGALEVIHRRGLSVPKDIAIVGFDDPPWATALRPALTSVRQPTQTIGRLAVELLLQRLNAPDSPARHLLLQPELVLRDSS